VVTAMTSLYLNIFVLVTQAFLKVPALHALAPSVPPSEPPSRSSRASCWCFCHCDHRRVEAISAGVIGPIRAVSNEMAVNHQFAANGKLLPEGPRSPYNRA